MNVFMAGYFITIEGGEGAGKTTLQHALSRRLEEAGFTVLTTREPGGTALGARLRGELLNGGAVAPTAELLLYAADRAQHVSEVIAPALARGTVVLCDRFSDSTLAYQGFGRGLDAALIRRLNRVAQQGVAPQLTLWLDLPVAKGLARVSGRGAGRDRFETEARRFHERVRRGFAELARQHPRRILRVDADQDPAGVLEACWQIVLPRVRRRHARL